MAKAAALVERYDIEPAKLIEVVNAERDQAYCRSSCIRPPGFMALIAGDRDLLGPR